MEPKPDQSKNRKTFQMVALAAGVWFLGSGIWGLLTEAPEDRATFGCEAAARAKAEPETVVKHTQIREQQGGWSVSGEVRQSSEGVESVTHRWECLTNGEGREPNLTGWTPVG